ncbi:MAG: type II toxin-antitoxin system RelE/ParE family toxin [Syntrophaceae bacterium]|nr:type II toxin-antitoxin system RelE/ParE family toxin [Syntrophaceae bacterium]
MAGSLIWSEQSLGDIEAIAKYIGRDSPQHAQRVVEEIFVTAEIVAAQPMMGRPVPEIGSPQIREHFIYSYRLIYEVRGETVYILGVIHGRRLLESINDRFDAG